MVPIDTAIYDGHSRMHLSDMGTNVGGPVIVSLCMPLVACPGMHGHVVYMQLVVRHHAVSSNIARCIWSLCYAS